MLGAAVAKKSWMSDVVLIVDAMSLRKGTVWEKCHCTYVNRTLIAYKVKIENYLNYKRN